MDSRVFRVFRVLGVLLLMLGLFCIWRLRRFLRERDNKRRSVLLEQQKERQQVARGEAAAAVRFLKEGKWPEALSALDRALGGVDAAPGLEVSLRHNRGWTLEQLGRSEEALVEYGRCQAPVLSAAAGPWSHLAALREGQLLVSLGRRQEGTEKLRQCLAMGSRLPGGAERLHLDATYTLIGLCRRAGDHSQALAYAEQGIRLARQSGEAVAEARLLRAAGRAHQALGRFDESLGYLEQSLDLFRRRANARGELETMRDIARLYQATGAWDQAFSWLRACLDDEEAAENLGAEARLCYDVACLSIDQGALIEAGLFLQRSLSLFRQAEDRKGIDEAGRTMMGLSVLVHRLATEDQITFRDIERGSKPDNPEEE